MENSKDFKDLQEIKNLMERSSRFLSLSGLSGVSAGIIALIGAAIAFYLLDFGKIRHDEYFNPLQSMDYLGYRLALIPKLVILAIITFCCALSSAIFFSWKKAKKNNLPLFNHTTKKLLLHLFIPLITGGIFAMILVYRNDITLLASVTLIFYGLALVNAGKYTFGEVQYLGICEIVLGLLAGLFTNFGLIIWTIGFGILHIVYGLVMYYRYER